MGCALSHFAGYVVGWVVDYVEGAGEAGPYRRPRSYFTIWLDMLIFIIARVFEWGLLCGPSWRWNLLGVMGLSAAILKFILHLEAGQLSL